MTYPATGRPTEPFELSGGALCLDFANTWGNHADPGTDRLRDYRHLVEFAQQTGGLSAGAAAALNRTAARNAGAAAAALSRCRDLRQSIYRVFSRVARGKDVPAKELDLINSVLGQALSYRKLVPRDGGFVFSWSNAKATDLCTPIWPAIESAAALLTSGELDRVRECDADDCNWLFMDRSRGGSRRWCSMTSCGNRAKARRHYHRTRAADKPG